MVLQCGKAHTTIIHVLIQLVLPLRIRMDTALQAFHSVLLGLMQYTIILFFPYMM